jgi:hypothetical protein
VLVLAAFLSFSGAGLMAAALYLVVTRAAEGWPLWAAALVFGPLLLYLASGLLRAARWAFLATIALLLLLAATAALRAVAAPQAWIGPLVELAAEAATLAYLLRPGMRRHFGALPPLRRADRRPRR